MLYKAFPPSDVLYGPEHDIARRPANGSRGIPINELPGIHFLRAKKCTINKRRQVSGIMRTVVDVGVEPGVGTVQKKKSRVRA